MSEYGVVKSMLTSAIDDLIRATSRIDQSYLQPFSSQAQLLDKYRSLCERNVGMTSAKFTVESALNILKNRYEEGQRFVGEQHGGETIVQDLNTYWEETKGADLLRSAHSIIFQLQSQIELELPLANQIRDKLGAIVASSEPSHSTSSQQSQSFETNAALHTNIIRANVSSAVPSAQIASNLEHQVVQLRSLEVPSFDGDQSRFYDFWARFKTMVHNNPALTTAAKFFHLISSLEGSAALVVERFDITNPQNYEPAITALLKRYDRPDFIHNHFLQKLEQLPPSSASASSQRDTLCRIEACVLQLDRFEDTSQSLPLKKLVLKKFPKETQLEVVKMEHRSGTTWSLHQLLEGFNQFIEELEKVDDKFLHPNIENLAITPPSADDDADCRPTTPLASYNPDACCFCASSDHKSSSCHRSVAPSVRRLAVDLYKLCYKCITLGHTAVNCSAPNCSRCGKDHHPLLCLSCPTTLSPVRRSSSHSCVLQDSYRPSCNRCSSRSSSREAQYSRRSSSCNYSRSPDRRRSYDRDSRRSTHYSSSSSRHSPHHSSSPPLRTHRHYSSYPSRSQYRRSSCSPYRRSSCFPYRRSSYHRSHSSHSAHPGVSSSTPSYRTRQDSPSLSRNRLSADDTSTDSEHKAIIDCFRSMKDASPSMLFSASTHQSILMIVQAYARNPHTGSLDPVSILLDSGAQTSFVTNSAVSRLALRPFGFRPLTTVAFGGHRVTEETGLVDVQLLDNTDKPFEVRLYTRNVVAAPRQAQQLHPEDFAALRSNGVDPESLLITQAVQPDILLGMNYFWEVISHGPPVVLPSGLVLSYTRFGPTVSGLSLFVNVAQVVDYSSAERSVDSVSRLWDLDLLGITDDPDPSVDKDEDARILRRFQNTAEEIGGYLYVQFPWKSSHPRLADNKLLAYKRLESQYRSLVSKPQLWKDYAAVFDDYLRLGIIEEVEEFKLDDHRVYYIPHQAVIKASSSTTKLRVVFDASSHYRNAPSLNDCLHSGPAILPDLVGILLRCRLTPLLLVSDVEKAFLQIRLQRSQRDATRFLWLRDPSLPPSQHNLRIFRFTRVPFGITASPFLLAASILYYLNRDPATPLKKEIQQNTYVDNVLLSANTPRDAIAKYRESKSLFGSMHMNLREFLCNSDAVNRAIHPLDRIKNISNVKLLGIPWKPEPDSLVIPLKVVHQSVSTKRTALRALSSTFDPLGLLVPFLAPIKVFIQDTWKKKYQWDDPFDKEDLIRWKQLVQDLEDPLPSIPRCVVPPDPSCKFELAVFGDASQRLYACCVYLICRSSVGTTSHLLMAKSRLGEVQPLTMPRMELLAALISARLVRFVHSQLHRPIAAVHIFSDSQITLHWIHSSRPLKRFVNNRVVEIRSIVSALQSSGSHVQFHYVQSELNPADCATRGLPTKSANNHIWWCGPSFLLLPSLQWPQANCEFSLPPDVSPEVENEFQTLHAIQVCSYQSPLRFKATNRYLKLVRSTVYVLKFVSALFRKIHHRPTSLRLSLSLPTKFINAVEFMFAEALVITEHYRESVHQLGELPLARFNAHRSADGLIHCPNRLEYAETSPISAAPILLVPGHPLTTTIVMHHHLENFHSGVHATIASLRTRFFIPSVRSTVAKILRGCIVCKKANCLPYRYPDMPSLPPERVNRFRPFQKVGLDYLGPLYYRDTFHTRGKVWICLFTCMATRAVHLEVVFNNSTQEFILAFRRFIARRGTPDYILSDNATTFCSANDTLQEVIYARSSVEKLSDFFANRKITWKFITPLSPWKGGFYERLVGLFKSAFRKAVHRSLLPLQEFQTLVFEVEAVLNARPLTSIRDTSTAPQILKPIDFISPEVELQIPPSERSSASFPSHRLTDWYRGTISALNQFWNIWYRDYLSLLADRHQKRTRQGRSSPVIPKVSDVVLVPEKNVPRGQWPLGVITALQCNRQKVPRSATVRMPNGRELVRSLNQLYPLEITAEEDQAEPKESGNVIPTRIQPPRAVKRVRSYSR
ncbi:hypothetical protein Aduo_017989 [Ancylostoma duodenale]